MENYAGTALPSVETERPFWENPMENRTLRCVMAGPLLFPELWAPVYLVTPVGRDSRQCIKDIINSMAVTRSGAVELLDMLTTIVGTHVGTLDRNQDSSIDTLTLLSSTHAREIKWAPWMDVMEDTAQRGNPQNGGVQHQVLQTPSPRPQRWKLTHPAKARGGGT